MKFLSIKEYFYKLNTIGFILLLLPIGLFIFLYFDQITHPPMVDDKSHILIAGEVVLAIVTIVLTTVHWLWAVRIKRLKKVIELAMKMDRYFLLMLLKLIAYSGCTFLSAAGFYLTGHPGFTAGFVLLLIAIAFQWPSPASFCRHLSLGRIESDMVMKNQDLYQRNKRV
jgi:hypothetical protein